MTERPILFSGPMVRAIIDGRKTMTRRVMKPQPELDGLVMSWKGTAWGKGRAQISDLSPLDLSPYQVGMRLWVRETFWVNNAGNSDGTGRDIVYRADNPDWPYGWRPSIFMPRWMSGITLEITSVRVERLQEINADDAIREGIEPIVKMGNVSVCQNKKGQYCTAKEAFRDLWDSINGKNRPWSSNPWVWVIEFKRTENNK